MTYNDVILQIEAIMVDSNSESGFFKDFQIPTSILVPESEVVNVDHVPKCPVIVFINSKSGGQLGGELLVTFCSLLNENQVPLVSCEEW
jgi:diacylglycerol kinase (ATP)